MTNPHPAPYRCRFSVRTELVQLRGMRHAVHHWGDESRPLLLLLHGWADTGTSFQFLADVLARCWHVVAPDWRGFGDSDRAPGGYWFPDYLADLDALLDHLSPAAAVRLLGHSMGGNIATLYAGARPDRVAALVNMEGLGLEPRPAAEAPGRYAQWLAQLREPPQMRSFASVDALAAHLRQRDPHLDAGRAQFVARCWSRVDDASGECVLKADPAHKRVNPVLYRHEEFIACMAAITAPTMLVMGRESWVWERFGEAAVRREIAAALGGYHLAVIDASGHMLHHDQPAAVAAAIAGFLRAMAS